MFSEELIDASELAICLGAASAIGRRPVGDRSLRRARRICRSSITWSFSRSRPQVKRIVEAIEMLGQPLAHDDKARLEEMLDSTGGEPAIRTIQGVLDKYCLVGIEINAESRVKSSQPARPRLVQNGWSVFLVKVHNEAGVTAELVAESPNAAPMYRQSSERAEPKASIRPADLVQRWADVACSMTVRSSDAFRSWARVSHRADL